MSRSVRSLALLAVAVGLVAFPCIAYATQGYFTIGTGAVNDGLAGAGVALPQDASSGAVNPASIVKLGNQYEVDGSLFAPSRQYSVSGNPLSPTRWTFPLFPGTYKSNDNYFVIPDLGYTHQLTPSSAFGLNIYANGGLNTDYSGSAGGGYGTFGDGGAGVNLEQLFIVPSYSASLNSKLSVGASFVLVYQVFSATGLGNFAAEDSTGSNNNLTNDGNDNTFSVAGKVGLLFQAAPTLKLGAVYESTSSGSDFKNYSNLFADQGSFNVPSTFTVGLAWDTSRHTTLALDVQQIEYSDVPAVSNSFSNLLAGQRLGSSDGPGFGWKNTTFVKLGYQEVLSPVWTLREGVAHGNQPIQSSQVLFNILAPGTTEWHYSLGATAKVSKKSDLSFAVVYAPTSNVTGPNPLAPAPQNITLSMHQVQAELGWSTKY